MPRIWTQLTHLLCLKHHWVHLWTLSECLSAFMRHLWDTCIISDKAVEQCVSLLRNNLNIKELQAGAFLPHTIQTLAQHWWSYCPVVHVYIWELSSAKKLTSLTIRGIPNKTTRFTFWLMNETHSKISSHHRITEAKGKDDSPEMTLDFHIFPHLTLLYFPCTFQHQAWTRLGCWKKNCTSVSQSMLCVSAEPLLDALKWYLHS